MKPTVYIDTTIPSYYVDHRESLTVHIDRTRVWWDEEARLYQVFASPLVIRELEEDDFPGQAEALLLIRETPLLAPNQEIADIVQVYLNNYLMPRSDDRDAWHLAISSYYRMDYLLTWNCSHLANVNKRRHIVRMNQMLGLYVPVITTPFELLPAEGEFENER